MMHTLSNFFSPVDCQEVSLCQARLLCYFDIMNWSLYFWISLSHVASINWEKSEFYLDFVDSISRETDCPTPCQRALAACWLSPRYSSSFAFLKAIHAECLCQLVHVHNPSAGGLFDTWATEQPKIQDIKNWLSMGVVFAFYVILSYFYSLKSVLFLTANLESDVQVQHLPIRLIVLINLHMQRNFL